MKLNKLSHLQIIAIGFALIILLGTVLLMLPVSTVKGESTDLLSALFTSVSASCVTGLVAVDTATHWTVFGQIVILMLIQIGGLGFMTVATVFLSFAKKNMGIRRRSIMAESINSSHIAGLKKITKHIIFGTLIFEGLGAVLLSKRFIVEFGVGKGIYYSVFHSVSAFCNAGFDLMGTKLPYDSLISYNNDALVNIVIMCLITVGGLGFLVWDDLLKNKFNFRKYSLHTKIVLVTSFVLTFGGAILFFVFENNSVLSGMTVKQKLLASLFSSVTCRTAGFNTVDLAAVSPASTLLMCMLMYVGGSSGSTAGGVKTTTIFVALVNLKCSLRGEKHAKIFNRTFEEGTFHKAAFVLIFNFLLGFFGTLTICAIQPLELSDVLFEAFSAIGTVGMSTGITRELLPASKLVIAFLMFCGRVGSTSFALALLEKRADPPIKYPKESITVG